MTAEGPALPGLHLRRAQHHRAQARRAAHPLPRALRHPHQDPEPPPVPALAAAGHRAHERAGRELALIYLDLDRFKEVNDTFGHAAGDRALEILSERMNRKLPRDTMLGRLAGDEFALFIENLPAQTDNRAAIGALARELLDELGRPFQLNQHELYVTGSVGIALCPRDADNVVDLIRDADAAMYYSKQNGGNSHSFFTPEMSAAAVERLMLKSEAAPRGRARRARDPLPAEGGLARRACRRWRGTDTLAPARTSATFRRRSSSRSRKSRT
jgi:diguanylate cyclase (GGDEF)-like protein